MDCIRRWFLPVESSEANSPDPYFAKMRSEKNTARLMPDNPGLPEISMPLLPKAHGAFHLLYTWKQDDQSQLHTGSQADHSFVRFVYSITPSPQKCDDQYGLWSEDSMIHSDMSSEIEVRQQYRSCPRNERDSR